MEKGNGSYVAIWSHEIHWSELMSIWWPYDHEKYMAAPNNVNFVAIYGHLLDQTQINEVSIDR